MTLKATAAANANIAIIKYWGRKDDRLRIPTNDSISFTMDDRLQSTTTVEWVPDARKDTFMLDGKPANENERARASAFLDIVRGLMERPMHAKIASKNTFPRAAGLASSASGFAALAAAATKAAGITINGKKLSALARLGSGSASRSVFGGAVEWKAGKRDDGEDCFAVQLSPPERWKNLRNVIAITNPHEKRISSTDAMERTVRTSGMFKGRLISLQKRIGVVRDAIKRCDFEAMAETIMQESDSMHACMLDSWPPITYLNGASLEIMHRVVELNQSAGKPVAAYTFDAGPNAHIYTTSKHEDEVKRLLSGIDGIQDVLVCRVGEGVRYPSEDLF